MKTFAVEIAFDTHYITVYISKGDEIKRLMIYRQYSAEPATDDGLIEAACDTISYYLMDRAQRVSEDHEEPYVGGRVEPMAVKHSIECGCDACVARWGHCEKHKPWRFDCDECKRLEIERREKLD